MYGVGSGEYTREGRRSVRARVRARMRNNDKERERVKNKQEAMKNKTGRERAKRAESGSHVW